MSDRSKVMSSRLGIGHEADNLVGHEADNLVGHEADNLVGHEADNLGPQKKRIC